MTGIDEEWEAAMTALRDLQATASRLCGEAARDKATAETIYENAIARADGMRAAIGRHAPIDRKDGCKELRDQAAIDLDKAASGSGPEKPSEGAAERARAQADVARDIARFLGEETKA